MNRRSFIQTTSLAAGALFLPFSIAAAKPKPKISWEDFDWLPLPVSLAFRLEHHGGGIHKLNSIPVIVKTWNTKLTSTEDVDLTTETKIINRRWNPYGRKVINMKDTVYTNETLLLAAKKWGFTHLYMFFKGPYTIHPITYQKRYSYYVRGAILPDWKTDHGKLQIINV
jgi:hypothetical protein